MELADGARKKQKKRMNELESKLALGMETNEALVRQTAADHNELAAKFAKLAERVRRNFDWREIVGVRHKAKMENVKLPADSDVLDPKDEEYAEPNGIKSWVQLIKHLYTSPFIKLEELKEETDKNLAEVDGRLQEKIVELDERIAANLEKIEQTQQEADTKLRMLNYDRDKKMSERQEKLERRLQTLDMNLTARVEALAAGPAAEVKK